MNILTIDVEDWYCNCVSKELNWNKFECRLFQEYDPILDALAERNLKASFFCLGWIAEKYPGLIKKIDAAGHHIGCHSYQHQLVTDMTPSQFRADTLKSKLLLEDVIGKEVNAYRAPAWSITNKNEWALDILCELGFAYDSSIFPAHHDFGGMPNYGKGEPTILKLNNGEIKEFPVNTHNLFGRNIVFSGGGFFRFVPYHFINKWTKETDYVMSYFHGQDFDVEQPIDNDLSLKRRFKTYYGIKGAYAKFLEYIDANKFDTLLSADTKIDWRENNSLILR